MKKIAGYNYFGRICITIIILIALATALAGRLCWLMLIDYEKYQNGAFQQYTTEVSINPKRGTIYDKNMKALAVSATVETVFISPYDIEEEYEELISSGLAEILEVDKSVIDAKMSKKKSQYQVIRKDVERETADKVREFIRDNDIERGIYLAEGTKRYYPNGNLASHIIGFTNYDNIGIYGIESQYEEYLKGTSGKIITAQNGKGGDMPFKYESYIDATNGINVVLTIDWSIQYFLEKSLETALSETGARNRVMGIVMDVNTGAVLGMATKPDYNLNDPFTLDETSQKKLDTFVGTEEEKNALRKNLLEELWKNKVITETYEPGSTFKVLTSAMGLDSGAISANDEFDCSGVVVVGGWPIHCHLRKGHGHENFEQGLQNSCNPVFVEVSKRVGKEAFYSYFEAFGLMEKTGIDLPGEVSSIYHDYNDFNETELAVYSFGQTFKVTPIQQLTAISAVANGGNLMKPYIVKELVDDDGNVIKSYEPTLVRQVVSEDACDTIVQFMANGITVGSTKNAYVKGYSVAAKTGTSQKRDTINPETGEKDLYVASCVALAPAEDPQVAVIVAIDEPVGSYYGGTIAAPVVSDILTDVLPYLNVPQTLSEEEKSMLVTINDYKGMSIDEAKTKIEALGFKTYVSGSGDTVAGQFPKSGTTVAKNGIIALYTESGYTEKTVIVPDLYGVGPSSANKILVNSSLNIEFSGTHGENVTGAVAFKQSPEAGTEVPVGTVVSVEFRSLDSSD